MFIEKYTDTVSNDKVTLTFLKSLNVQVFPCGHRRSTVLSDEVSRIPFDPEARLNTELNNLKRSSLNGFTQTYLDLWDETYKKLTVSLAGYLFSIDLDDSYIAPDEFGTSLAKKFEADISNIYLNIIIEDTPLFVGEPKAYTTSVLGSLVESNDESALDLLVRGKTESSSSKDDYYFSGLAFSPMPLVSAVRDKYSKVASFNTRDDFSFLVKIGDNQVVKKRIVSLHLLEKVEGEWKIHEPARLPVVKHGQDRDSVVIDNLQISRLRTNELFSNEAVLDTVDIGSATAEKINVTKTASIEELNVSQVNAYHINIDNKPVPTVELKESGGYYQLQFTLGN
jgi:hypothetical protein